VRLVGLLTTRFGKLRIQVKGDVEKLRHGEHLQKDQIIITWVFVMRRDDRDRARLLTWKSIIRALA
jgi:hypothetical protein